MYTWCFVLNSKATSEIYTNVHTLALHDALPIARHRAVDLRRRVARRRREGRAAATPQGRADAAGACAAGALLLPRLLAAAAYFALGELSLGARATSRHVGADHLVDQRLVVLGAEDDVGNVQCVSAVMYLNIDRKSTRLNSSH